jgi:hypothetical protein
MTSSTEERYQQQLRLFEAISATTPDFLYVFDVEGRFLYANRRLLEVWGVTAEQAVGKSLTELGYPQWHADMHLAELRQVIETKRPIKGVVPFTGGSGIAGVYEYIFSPVLGPDGAVEAIAGTTRDVTDRHRADEQARTILESITDAFFAVDRDWRFTYVNRQAEHVLGRAPGDLLGEVLWDEYPGLRGSEFEAAYRRTADERAPRSLTAHYPDHGRWYEVHAYPAPDGGISVYFRDATDRKRAEEQLHAQSVVTETVTRNAAQALYLLDADGLATYANPAAEALFGWPRDQTVGKRLHDLIHYKHPDGSPYPMEQCPLSHCFASGRTLHSHEDVFVRRDGSFVSVLCSMAPISRDGRPAGAVLAIIDITDRKRAEQQLRRSHDTFYHLIQNNPFGVYVVDADFRLREVSLGAQKVFAHVRPLLGRDFAEVLRTVWAEPFAAEAIRLFRHTLDTGEPYASPRTVERRQDVGDIEAYDWRIERVTLPDGRFGVVCYFYDLSERQRWEATVRDREERFRQLADAMPQIVWAATPDGALDYYNRRWFEYIGIPEERAGEATVWDRFVHPDDMVRVAEAWAASLSSGRTYNVEFRVRGKGDRYCWFLVRAEPARDDGGRVVRWYGTCTDIEHRKRAEERDRFLLALDEAVRPLTDPAEITAAHARLLGGHLAADRCAYADVEDDQDTFNLTGDYTRGVPSIVGRYRFAEFGQEVLALMRADRPYVVEDVDSHRPPVGDLTAYRATMIQSVVCVPLHKGGRFVAAMAVHQKVPRRWTADEVALVQQVAARCWESIERARVERTLRESEARFRGFAEHSEDVLWISAAAGDPRPLLFVSPSFERVWGRPAADVIADPTRFFEWMHPDDRPPRLDPALGVDSGPFTREYRIVRPDGSVAWIRDRGFPIRDAAGRPAYVAGIASDMTTVKDAEARREAALVEAERAGRMKDEFLATLSHELRTPLNAILGWAQILRGNPGDAADVAEGVEIIERNARAQTQIIEDLLDMSRIVSGKIRLDVRPLDLAGVVRAAVETVRPAADAKGVRLDVVPDPLVGPVTGDPNRLQQVFWNLLTNAVKFTPRGGRVRVAIDRVDAHVEVSVNDTGEGIPPDFLPYVFDRFRQADATTTRRHGGLGLGLAIVRQLAEVHGGSVRVTSGGAGRGSTFTVALPLTPTAAGPDAASQPPDPGTGRAPLPGASCASVAGVRVLVVDDEPDARGLVKRLLEDCGAVVTTAGSAQEAFERVRAERPDVLVSDIGMPGEDGYALIRRVRALGAAQGGEVPAVALTAYARAEDRMKAVLAGFQHHVVKPVEPAELITMIAGLAKRSVRDGAPARRS